MNDRLSDERKCPSEPFVAVMGKNLSAEKENSVRAVSHAVIRTSIRQDISSADHTQVSY